MRAFLIISFVLSGLVAHSSHLDSLYTVYQDKSSHDTLRLEAFKLYIWDGYIFSNPDSAEILSREMLEFAQQRSNLTYQSDALRLIGVAFLIRGDYVSSAEYYRMALKLREHLGDKSRIASSLNDIGGIYQNQGDLQTAKEHYQRSLAMFKEINDKAGLSRSYNNLAAIYDAMGERDSLLYFFELSLELEKEIGASRGIPIILINIGSVHSENGNYDLGIEYGEKALHMSDSLGDTEGIARALNYIAHVYNQKGNTSKFIEYCEEALALSVQVGSILEMSRSAEMLYEVYKKLGNDQKALDMYELAIELRDSMHDMRSASEVLRQEYQYEYDKKATADSIRTAEASRLKDAQLKAEQAENKRSKQQSFFLYIGLALTLIFGAVIFNRFRITRKQKEIIIEQKSNVDHAYEILEVKNQEIIDSIAYAKRIQSAILPPNKLVSQYLNKSFILYKPKDIVAGDFYWMEPQKDRVLFAVADCTGHGVPGAMVSVVCNNGLNRSVREHGLTDPGEILNKTREIIINEFEKSEEDVKDGMDIALCSLEGAVANATEGESAVTLQYAGAHNPLWIIRQGTSEIEEIKADKQPIGKYAEQKPFTTHSVRLFPGDTVYIFSDGFADQFGGDKGKKFKSTNFKRLLLSMQNESMDRQKELIDSAFEEWRGNLEQVDDICVIGFQM